MQLPQLHKVYFHLMCFTFTFTYEQIADGRIVTANRDWNVLVFVHVIFVARFNETAFIGIASC